MTNACFARLRNNRGAVLVHVTVAILGLVAFSALVIDYGVMWSSRRQAQNAADAAAMAGAISLAFDDPDDLARARQSAVETGTQNEVFGLPPDIDPDADISFPACPPGAPGIPDTCVRANVYRNEDKGALPTFFARLFGRSVQGVKATATAQILTGNASECLKPWGIADKWEEHWENGAPNNGQDPGVWNNQSTFDKWAKVQGTWTSDPAVTGFTYPDYYRAAGTNGTTDAGTGFQPFDADNQPTTDYGLELGLKLGGGTNPNERISAGWFLALDLDLSGNAEAPESSGAQKYGWAINNCSALTSVIGQYINVECGNMAGQTAQNTYGSQNPNDELGVYEKDPAATWNATDKTIDDSCAPGVCADGKYYTYSPRIVPVPVFDVNEYLAANPSGCQPGTSKIRITNLLGFFILPSPSNPQDEVRGVLVSVPGLTVGSSTIPATASYLRQVILVR
jgi:Putative Flp pilus-assembly TadE/G-like